MNHGAPSVQKDSGWEHTEPRGAHLESIPNQRNPACHHPSSPEAQVCRKHQNAEAPPPPAEGPQAQERARRALDFKASTSSPVGPPPKWPKSNISSQTAIFHPAELYYLALSS